MTKKISAMPLPSIPGAPRGDGEPVTFFDYVMAAEEAAQEGRLEAAAHFIELAYSIGDQPAPATIRRDRIH